ncbi:MAG: hypothetical protein RIS70_505 [Planctomycetota bacterium]
MFSVSTLALQRDRARGRSHSGHFLFPRHTRFRFPDRFQDTHDLFGVAARPPKTCVSWNRERVCLEMGGHAWNSIRPLRFPQHWRILFGVPVMPKSAQTVRRFVQRTQLNTGIDDRSCSCFRAMLEMRNRRMWPKTAILIFLGFVNSGT